MAVSRYLDRLAITLSAICVVHCLAMPFAAAILPIAALALGGDSHFHALMLWLVVPTSAVGFTLGYRVHRSGPILAAGVAAVSVLAVVALWGHAAWPPRSEIAVNIMASALLAAAHWRNFRAVRRLHSHS